MPPSSGNSAPTQSNVFKLLAVIVTLLLLTALVFVIWLVLTDDSLSTTPTNLGRTRPANVTITSEQTPLSLCCGARGR